MINRYSGRNSFAYFRVQFQADQFSLLNCVNYHIGLCAIMILGFWIANETREITLSSMESSDSFFFICSTIINKTVTVFECQLCDASQKVVTMPVIQNFFNIECFYSWTPTPIQCVKVQNIFFTFINSYLFFIMVTSPCIFCSSSELLIYVFSFTVGKPISASSSLSLPFSKHAHR